MKHAKKPIIIVCLFTFSVLFSCIFELDTYDMNSYNNNEQNMTRVFQYNDVRGVTIPCKG